MTWLRLLRDNLLFHRRGNFAVFLGIALGTAILTGALFVGDSLRGSLRDLTRDQLGWVEQAMTAPRFFRAELASKFEPGHAAAAILLQGSAALDEPKARTVPKVTVLGVTSSFWQPAEFAKDKDGFNGAEPAVALNETLAEAMKAKVGDRININVQKAELIPRESLLGRREAADALQTLTVTVKQILRDDDRNLGKFNLKPSSESPRNAFVPLGFLQDRLGQRGRANTLLHRGQDPAATLQKSLTLDDWNLSLTGPDERAKALIRFLDPRNDDGRLKKNKWQGRVPDGLASMAGSDGVLTAEQIGEFYRLERPYYQLESRQMFLDFPVEAAVEKATAGMPLLVGRSLVYLADTLTDGKADVPYAVVVGTDATDGPKEDEIDVASWAGSPLQVSPGDSLTVGYYSPDDHNQLTLKKETFKVRRVFEVEGVRDDPDWTPEFPGITDKLDMAGWENPPFPYNSKRIKPADENYWKRHKTTPKAYISLATAQRLWSSRFGDLTSIRFTSGASNISLLDLEKELLTQLAPASGGFVFFPVRDQGLQAGGGATDFSMLFLAFSAFLIVAALLLVGLLVRLNLDRRSQEIGLLLALGWSKGRVRNMLLGEGLLLAVLGGLCGLGLAVAYASWLLDYLRDNWPGEVKLNFLRLHTNPASFATGFLASLFVSFGTIVWATRVLGKLSPRGLLAGETVPPGETLAPPGKKSLIYFGIFTLIAIGCFFAGFSVEGHEAKAGSFFSCGAALLTALLIGVWRWLKRLGRTSQPQPTVTALGIRNAGRHVARSLLTVSLLASATFIVTAVDSFHKEAGADFSSPQGGSGGFPLLAESDVPIFQDLNDPKVRANLDVSKEERAILDKTKVFACRLRAGDDASCLNLYQPLKPKILGVPKTLVAQNRFHFGRTMAVTAEELANPWPLLENPGSEVPAFVDANSAQWILKVGLGDTLEVPDQRGRPVKLKIVGLLQESIFQSEVLVAESRFLEMYPSQEGFNFFLFDGPWAEVGKIQSAWEAGLRDQGIAPMPTVKRLENFLAVENTYLATFKALGGLGLLLGSVGLAIVLLRGVWERRGELALLRALGFRIGSLTWLVLVENAFLLVIGLAVGSLAALGSIAPHLVDQNAGTVITRWLTLLAGVAAIGLGSGLLAVLATLRAPLVPALRKE